MSSQARKSILHDYESPREARQGIAEYIRLYNYERPHQALDDRRPYQLDQSDLQDNPYTVAETNYCVRLLQPPGATPA